MPAKKVRKQVYLTQAQNEELKTLALMRNTSEASLIRKAIDLFLAQEEGKTTKDPLQRLIGLGKGQHTDNAQRHDYYLYGEEEL